MSNNTFKLLEVFLLVSCAKPDQASDDQFAQAINAYVDNLAVGVDEMDLDLLVEYCNNALKATNYKTEFI